jgi:NADH:ubiquinone oxidoreductase subunit 6 (subunit J)
MGLFSSIIVILFGLAAIAAGAVAVSGRDPVRSAVALLGVMVSIGVMFLALGAILIGILQLAVASAFIFFTIIRSAIRMPAGESRRDSIPSARVLAPILAAILLVILVSMVISGIRTGAIASHIATGSIIQAAMILRKLVTGWAYSIELVAVLAVAAYAALRHFRRMSPTDSDRYGGEP